jgi:hypothetical protein
MQHHPKMYREVYRFVFHKKTAKATKRPKCTNSIYFFTAEYQHHTLKRQKIRKKNLGETKKTRTFAKLFREFFDIEKSIIPQ